VARVPGALRVGTPHDQQPRISLAVRQPYRSQSQTGARCRWSSPARRRFSTRSSVAPRCKAARPTLLGDNGVRISDRAGHHLLASERRAEQTNVPRNTRTATEASTSSSHSPSDRTFRVRSYRPAPTSSAPPTAPARRRAGARRLPRVYRAARNARRIAVAGDLERLRASETADPAADSLPSVIRGASVSLAACASPD